MVESTHINSDYFPNSNNLEMTKIEHVNISNNIIDPDVKLVSRNDLFIEMLLGKGYFASVFLVTNSLDNKKYAMKLSKHCKEQQFELNVLHSLSHENILRIYGACYIDTKLACITEFAAGGALSDLLTHLESPPTGPTEINSTDLVTTETFHWTTRVKLALDIIKGLNYLHSKNLIHRDSSSQNILLRIREVDTPLTDQNIHNDSNNNSNRLGQNLSDVNYELKDDEITFLSTDPSHDKADKILFDKYHPVHSQRNVKAYQAIVGDMGLVLDMNRWDSNPMEIHGNPFYTPPEILLQQKPYSYASDIFAFGILCCELILCVVNDGSKVPRIPNFGLDSENMVVPDSCLQPFFTLAKDCCSINPSSRPSGLEIEGRLTHLLSILPTDNN